MGYQILQTCLTDGWYQFEEGGGRGKEERFGGADVGFFCSWVRLDVRGKRGQVPRLRTSDASS